MKEGGGLGFRNFEAFNLALLGKQGWNLIQDPDTIISKIFKARYYPRGDFIQAKIGHNPNFTWRSIWYSRLMLVEGCRWKVGNGQKIYAWRDLGYGMLLTFTFPLRLWKA